MEENGTEGSDFHMEGCAGRIATAQILHQRIRSFNPICPHCGQENEFIMHVLFFCPLSQVTWFISPFALRVDHLLLNFAETLVNMMRVLDNDQFIGFSNILWCVWKARNEFIFKGKNTTPQAILAQATTMGIAKPMRQISRKQDGLEVVPVPIGAGVILMDASWDCTKKTGTAFIVFNGKGEQIFVQTRSALCTDPLQAEAMALLQVLQYIKGEEGAQPVLNTLICTDCKILVKAITRNDYLELPSWQAAEVMAQGAQLYQQMMENITLRHVNRKMLPEPHLLAN